MTDQPVVLHHTYTLERSFRALPDRTFQAWSDPASKRRWFVRPGDEHELDFRVGGIEVVRAPRPNEPALNVESRYIEIVPGKRIVYSTTLFAGRVVATASLTSVEFSGVDGGTRLVLTEADVFLDGLEQPSWREQGTADWLARLGDELRSPVPS
jgi:uncharacterized protein YndB with AHSA1/START domain